MEFFLIKEKNIRFCIGSSIVEATSDSVSRKSLYHDPFPLLLRLVNCETPSSTHSTFLTDGETHLDTYFRDNLKSLLVKNCAEDNRNPTTVNFVSEIRLTVTSLQTGKLLLIPDEYCYFFKGLRSTLPETSFRFGLNLTLKCFQDFRLASNVNIQVQIEGEDSKVVLLPTGNYGIEVAIGRQFPKEMWDLWIRRDVGFSATITLKMHLNPSGISILYSKSLADSQLTGWTRNLLREGIATDLVILAGGSKDKEKGLKCHKCILSGRSPVFRAMFEAGMVESRNNCLEIEDMSEVGVKALLEFIYGWDLEEASKDCGIALELLKAGDKYQMEDLEDAMIRLICAMPFQWFSEDVAADLKMYAGNVGGKLGKVEEKSLAVLNWYAD